MAAQLAPIVMGVIALVATLLKLRSDARAEAQGISTWQTERLDNRGLVSVSGVTVEQLRAIVDVLEKQKSGNESKREQRS